MKKHKRYVREGMLDLIEKNGEKAHDFTARYLATKNKVWITISQLCLEGSKEVLASHLNLPVHKLTATSEVLSGWKKGQTLSLKARVSTYSYGGVTRGTLVGYGDEGLIDVHASASSSTETA